MTPWTRSRHRQTPNLPAPLTFEAIGTRWQIDTRHPLTPSATSAVCQRAETFDRVWSRFREDSVVSHISRHPGRHELPPEATTLLTFYRDLYTATAGAVSPLVGRTLEDWGYDRSYRLTPARQIAPVPRWEDAFSFDNGAVTTTSAAGIIDVGAAGKGFLVDLLAAVLRAADVLEYTIDASGDLLHRADPQSAEGTLRVALEHPLDPRLAVGTAQVSDGALCASAANRRSWPGAHHIIDALTGRPTEDVIATWALAATCLEADGLATALFFTPGEVLSEHFDFEFVRMFRSGRCDVSANFPGEIFR